MKKTVVGIDIGGTNIDIAFVDKKGEILLRSHHATNEYPQFQDFVKALAEEIKYLKSKNNIDVIAIGIGAPNGNYYNGTIEYAPNLEWKGIVQVVKMIENEINIPAFITNDANAAAMGEMLYGGAKGLQDFVYITLGTGVGSGIVVNGRLVYGHDGFAGEIGHTIVEENGRLCGCGRKGCLETYSSVSGLIRSVLLLKSQYPESILNNYDKNDITGKIIYEAAVKGDSLALHAFDIAVKKLGLALANVSAITSPHTIFLFGGLAKAKEFIFKPVKNNMEKNLLNVFRDKIELKPSLLADNEAAIKGAAALAWNEILNTK